MNKRVDYKKVLFAIAAALCLIPQMPSAGALVLGVLIAITIGNPWIPLTKKYTSQLLQISVMGLGAGMNLNVVAKVGMQGIGYTVIGILTTCTFGFFLGKWLKVDKATSVLITVGTAICGGSAIAAVAPVIRAKSSDVSIALGTVFLLNAVALLIFPVIGHYFGLTETQFGLWGALAIHDTSSVVGATMQYGPHALEVGTTVKLARALWIVPVTFAISQVWSRNQTDDEVSKEKPKRPWFILGFLIAAAIVTWLPSLRPFGHEVEFVAKRLLVLTLFLIGSNLNMATLKKVGFKPFVQGVALWIAAAAGTLSAIMTGWVHG